jgi:catechol 2,3-dioxygenase-like lactoylglutathione lyase family enzyme
MYNHISVGTRDPEGSARFYDAVLGALGYKRTLSESFGNAWGVKWPEFWVTTPETGDATAGNGVHVAFIAPSREAVDAFHAAALAEGGSDAGAPGLRAYTEDYYAAFVRDLDGNKIEAVHLPYVPFPES